MLLNKIQDCRIGDNPITKICVGDNNKWVKKEQLLKYSKKSKQGSSMYGEFLEANATWDMSQLCGGTSKSKWKTYYPVIGVTFPRDILNLEFNQVKIMLKIMTPESVLNNSDKFYPCDILHKNGRINSSSTIHMQQIDDKFSLGLRYNKNTGNNEIWFITPTILEARHPEMYHAKVLSVELTFTAGDGFGEKFGRHNCEVSLLDFTDLESSTFTEEDIHIIARHVNNNMLFNTFNDNN